jgi:putrescine transport system substrate-binding protein
MRLEWRGIAGSLAGIFMVSDAVAANDTPTVLHMANRPDYIAQDTVQKFSAETGIQVQYDTVPSDDSVFAALNAGNKPGWDLVVTSAMPGLLHVIAGHLVQAIDRAKLLNADNLDPEILSAIAAVDPGNRFAIPYLWGTSGLGLNLTLLHRSVPDAPSDSLALLFDPALAARVSACGIGMTDTPEDGVPAALAFLGLDPTVQDERSLAKAGELLAKIKPFVRRLSIDDFAGELGAGRLCVGFGPSSAVSDARSRADEAADGPDITYVIPKERARRWIDVMVMPVGAAHEAAAYAFIDYILRPEVISDITDWTGAANPNTLAADFVDEDDKADPSVFPSSTQRNLLYLDKPLTAELERARQRVWTRTRP